MLLYNTNGTVSNIIINAIIDGKVTSSLESSITIKDSSYASASNAIYQNAINAASSSRQAYNLAYPSGSANRNGRR